MMRFKKAAAMLLTTAMAASMLAGCGNSSDSSDSKDVADGADQKESNEDQGDTGDVVTLRYAAWDLGTEEENNIYRRMIEKYNEDHPNVKVELAEDITTDNWNESLSSAAAGGNLPDVFMMAEVPSAVANDWVLDVSDMAAGDEEWNSMPEYLRDSAAYNGKTFGIPYGMNLTGVYVNVDLFEQKNQPVLQYGYTFDEFDAAVKNMTDVSSGITALKTYDVVDWYPAVQDSKYGWFTYKDGVVNLTDPVFIQGVKYAQGLLKSGSGFGGLTEEQKSAFGTDSDWDAFNAGKIAMAVDPTSNATGYAKLPFKTKFVGLPNGKSVIIPDYVMISNTTEHPQEAYDFVRWMTFAKEGIMAKLDAIEGESELAWGSLPLNNDPEILDRFFKNYPVEGVREVYDNMEGNSIVEAFKFTPGYANARWEAPTGITAKETENAKIADVIDACVRGELNIDDYAEQLNTLSNSCIQEVMDEVDALTK